MSKKSGRLRAVCETTPSRTAVSDLGFRKRPLFFIIFCISFGTLVSKPDHIADLERRQKALEDEVANASLHCSTDDPMILDLKRRILHLRDELETFRHKAIADRRLH